MQQYNIAGGITKPANMGNEQIGTRLKPERGLIGYRHSVFPGCPIKQENRRSKVPLQATFPTFSAIARLISTLTTDPVCELYRTDRTSQSIDVCRKRPWSALGNSRSDEAQRRRFF